jgi:hypothetical protein
MALHRSSARSQLAPPIRLRRFASSWSVAAIPPATLYCLVDVDMSLRPARGEQDRGVGGERRLRNADIAATERRFGARDVGRVMSARPVSGRSAAGVRRESHGLPSAAAHRWKQPGVDHDRNEKGRCRGPRHIIMSFFGNLERARGFEPPTPTLARLRITISPARAGSVRFLSHRPPTPYRRKQGLPSFGDDRFSIGLRLEPQRD